MMTIYVLFGGMIATSWVQIIKAVFLMAGMIIMSFMVLWKFNFNIGAMFTEVKTATSHGADYLNPGIQYTDPLGTLIADAGLSARNIWSATYFDALFHSKRCANGEKFCYYCYLDDRNFLYFNIIPRVWSSYICRRKRNFSSEPGRQYGSTATCGSYRWKYYCLPLFVLLPLRRFWRLLPVSFYLELLPLLMIFTGKLLKREGLLKTTNACGSLCSIRCFGRFHFIIIIAQYLNVAFLVSLAFCIAASANLPVILYTVYWKRFNTTGAVTHPFAD